MEIFKIMLDKNNKPMIYKYVRNNEEGLIIFGASPDHITPMKIINKFLGKKVLSIHGRGLMIHLFLPEKYMKLWSDKIGTKKELQTNDGCGFYLSKMKKKNKTYLINRV